MKNMHSTGMTLTHTNGGTAQLSGTGFKVGDMVGYWIRDVAANAVGVLQMEGVIEAACKTTDTPAVGAKLYWDDTAKELTTTATANTFAGRCWLTKVTGPAVVLVKLQHAGL
jgi:predicted RecA/RadA family phage recombinase